MFKIPSADGNVKARTMCTPLSAQIVERHFSMERALFRIKGHSKSEAAVFFETQFEADQLGNLTISTFTLAFLVSVWGFPIQSISNPFQLGNNPIFIFFNSSWVSFFIALQKLYSRVFFEADIVTTIGFDILWDTVLLFLLYSFWNHGLC